MATSYPGAVQVGSYFVGQYYQVLQQQPDFVHQFYTESSSMIRIDGDSSETASAMLQIHNLIMSLNFTAIEIKTINSVDSWNGGVLVMVSGSVKTKDFSARRKFVQTFFLAPQEKGFFVLNDIFQFIADEPVYQPPAPILAENKYETQLDTASPLPEPAASNYVLEEEARDYVDSVHLEDDPVDKYSIPEQQQYSIPEQHQYSLPEEQQYNLQEEQQQHDLEEEIVVEEAPEEEASTPLENVVNTVQEPPAPVVEEPVGEPQKKTYASILRVARGQAPLVTTQSSYQKSAPAYSEWDYPPQLTTQHSNVSLSSVPESGPEAAEESLSLEEGELKSVYVRNLPSTVTAAEIEQEFMNFGRIRPDGVFIRFRKEIGACYAFVEFEDLNGVQNAIQASPIQLAGRQIYIEERRPNSSGASRGGIGGRRGRGRGSYQTEAPRGRFGGRSSGRGSSQDGGDYNSTRGNGYYQRVSR